MAPITQDYRGMTRQELYALAQERDIEGRSRLSKDELVEALELDDVGPDAVTLLLGRHDEIRELFARFDELSSRPSKKKQKLVHNIVTYLMGHVQIEEQVLYPAVRTALPELDREVDVHLERHHVAELLMSELEAMAPAEERYDAKVTVLIEHVTQHLDEEEEQLFPWVQDEMDAFGRRELGAAMTATWGQITIRPRWHVASGSSDEVTEAGGAETAPTSGPAGTSRSIAPANAALPAPEPAADDHPEGEASDQGVGDEAMTRSEEELVVGTTTREAGTAKLRKQVVSEHVTESVPVERETAVVRREPVSDADRDAASGDLTLSEDEREVLLHEEEVVAEKRTVPKERVRLGKHARTDHEVVEGDVDREDIEVVVDDEHDDDDGEVIDLAGRKRSPRT